MSWFRPPEPRAVTHRAVADPSGSLRDPHPRRTLPANALPHPRPTPGSPWAGPREKRSGEKEKILRGQVGNEPTQDPGTLAGVNEYSAIPPLLAHAGVFA